MPGEGVPHRLPGRLIVSLTSYPPRYATLSLTLRSLLSQRVRPDRTILWVAHGHAAALPPAVTDLVPFGLEVRECDDIRSFKKIIPALEAFPDAFIVTADDDQYYPPEWLAELERGYLANPGSIVCHRARVMRFDERGAPLAYRSWRRAVSPAEAPLLPTGFGGVLYPPHSLAPQVSDRELFEALCPEADDLWLKWMSAAAGTRVTLMMSNGPRYSWPNSQRVALARANVRKGGNDRQAAALAGRFGTGFFVAAGEAVR